MGSNFKMSKLTVEVVCGIDALDTLRNEWKMLFSVADNVSPFLSWEWAITWQRWLSRGRVPYIFCARSGSKLVGLLSLGEETRSLSVLPARVRRLFFLGEGTGGADYLDVLALPGCEQEAASTIFDYLAKYVPFDVLELDNMAADSLSLPLLAQQFDVETIFRYRFTPRFVCPQVKFDDGWADVLKRSRRASNFKRRLNQLRKHDGFEYRSIIHPQEVGNAFERFLRLHEVRWANEGGSELTGHSALQEFHREAVERLTHAGLLRFDELWVEGACIASIYGIDNGRNYYFYNSGYDPAWKMTSPGLVLLGLSLEDAARRGIKCYDFLRGDENYKSDWANATRKTVCVRVSNRRLLTEMSITYKRVQMAFRAAARNMLPESSIKLARRWRRYMRHKRTV